MASTKLKKQVIENLARTKQNQKLLTRHEKKTILEYAFSSTEVGFWRATFKILP